MDRGEPSRCPQWRLPAVGVNDTEDELLQRFLERTGRTLPTPVADTPVPTAVHDADLVPDVEQTDRSEIDIEIDTLLDSVDILDAYQRWCGKMTPDAGGKRESIMISCPIPGHRDSNPSAWVNLDKQTWFCGTCQQGGDKFDIAAWHFGYDVPGYKGKSFPNLRRAMASDLGLVIQRTLGGQEYVAQEPGDQESTGNIEGPITTEDSVIGPTQSVIGPESKAAEEDPQENLGVIPTDNVVQFPAPENEVEVWQQRLEAEMADVAIDWETIVPPDTFLWEWMESCTQDDLPHEYYFWLGMQALAFAAGTDVLLDDYRKIKANINVVLYGRTGSGKSRSIEPFARLVRDAMPWDGDDFKASTGVQLLPSPASAEALLRMFSHDIKDMSTMQVIDRAQVRGLLRVEEFASFVARASRPTNPMKETLIELFDVLDHTIKHASVTGGVVQAHNPFAQMITSTQPKAIHAFLKRTDAESGFMNRWIFATGTRRRERISYGNASIDITGSTAILTSIHQWAKQGHLYRLDGAALTAWDEFFHSTIVPLHDTNDESMLSRIDLILKKLIILFAVNSRESQPSVDSVNRAIALYTYLKRTSLMFSVDIQHSAFEECRSKIHEVVAKSGKEGVTLRQIGRYVDAKYERPMVLQVIKTMIDLGEIEEDFKKGRSGPGKTLYVIGA